MASSTDGFPLGSQSGEATLKSRVHALEELLEVSERSFIEGAGQLEETNLRLAALNEALTSEIQVRRKAEAALTENMAELARANERLQASQIQLMQSEKMATIGQLAAGVAHEINNPMAFLYSNLGTLSDYVGTFKELARLCGSLVAAVGTGSATDQQAVVKDIKEVSSRRDLPFILADVDTLLKESVEGAIRVKDIVQNLKTFARADEAEIKDADVNDCIESSIKIIWNELKHKCQVHKHLGQLPVIHCNPGQLSQVFMNLLMNAAQAIPEKGDITIQSEVTDREIVVRISDTGIGIPSENLSRLFTPFFTTKPIGKGTGLGLSVSYGIVKKHKGAIEVSSEVGKGSTFTVRLPVAGLGEESDTR